MPKVGAGEVQLKMLAAAMHPMDGNMLEGTYPVRAEFPAVGGTEGVGEVEAVGSGVKDVKVGDWVIPAAPGFGTWRQYAVAKADGLVKLPSKDIPVESAALALINPGTALRMLNDFVDLKEGDVVIQNGASGAVGQAVVQLAALRGIKVISVLRGKEAGANDETIERLKSWGSYLVVEDGFLRKPEFKELTSDLPAPKLALNGTGGDSASELLRALAPGGTMVTYGAASKQPVVIPNGAMIFEGKTVTGFWLSKWMHEKGTKDVEKMLEEIVPLIKDGKLRMWIERRKFSKFWIDGFAAWHYEQGTAGRKQVMLLHE